MTPGPAKVVRRMEEHVLAPGEQLIGLVLDNSPTIESGGRAPGGARYHGDRTAQQLATRHGFDLDQRVPCGVLALTDRRLISARWPIEKQPELYAEVPLPGPRLTYAERRGRLSWRTYLLVELGDGRFTTAAVQPRSFGLTAVDTKAGLDALIAGFGDATRVELRA